MKSKVKKVMISGFLPNTLRSFCTVDESCLNSRLTNWMHNAPRIFKQ